MELFWIFFSRRNPLCFDLRVIDAQPHHPCFNWNQSRVECEIDWPCEVRQFLVTLSPLINLTRGLLSWGTLFVILLGLFLNLLSLYTLTSSGLSKSGSGVYLVSLAVCDCGNLVANYGVGIARAHIHHFNELFMDSEWLCRWHGVFVEIFQLISAWIVVSFTVERCLAVWYPMMLRHTNRTGRAKKVVSTLSSVFTCFSLTKLILTGFEKDSVFGYPACFSHRYRWHGMAYLRVAFQTWIPTIMVFTFNIFMFCKLRRIKRARRRLTEINRAKVPAQRRASFINRPSPTAPMLVAVSLAYLVLVFPLGVVQTVELLWTAHYRQPVYGIGDAEGRLRYIQWKNTKLLLKYLRSFCFAFYQINYAINFFLYFAAGLQFRVHLQKKLKQFCRRWCHAGLVRAQNLQLPNTPPTNFSSSTNFARGGSRKSILSHHTTTNGRTAQGKIYQKRNSQLTPTPLPSPLTQQSPPPLPAASAEQTSIQCTSPADLIEVEVVASPENEMRRFELDMMGIEEEGVVGDEEDGEVEEALSLVGIPMEELHLPPPLVPTPSPIRSRKMRMDREETESEDEDESSLCRTESRWWVMISITRNFSGLPGLFVFIFLLWYYLVTTHLFTLYLL